MSASRHHSPKRSMGVERKIKNEPMSDSEDNNNGREGQSQSHRHSDSHRRHGDKSGRHSESRRRRHSSGDSSGDRREKERRRNRPDSSRHHPVKKEPTEDRRSPPARHKSDRHEAKRERSPIANSPPQRRRNDRPRRVEEKIDESQMNWGRPEPKVEKPAEPQQPKEKPTLELSGKLAVDTNTFKGVLIKYNQPAEARQPRIRWRLYPFKGTEALDVLYVHRQSAYLIGRERRVVDLPIDHPSCSKQHAVLQYRLVPHTKPDGTEVKRIKPYIIDLASANGTYVNGQRIDAQRYVELFERDVLKFGFSSREYVLLNENSQDVSSPTAETADGSGAESD